MKNKNKKLLTEAQIRRFMILSGNKSLADGFFKKINEVETSEEVEEIGPEEMSSSEMEPESAQESEAEETVVKKLVDAIAAAIQDVSGVKVDVASKEEKSETPPMGDETEEPMPPADEDTQEEEEYEEEMDEALKEEKELVTQNPKKMEAASKDQKMKPVPPKVEMNKNFKQSEKFVNEVAKRVAKRLVQEFRKNQ